MFKVNTVLSCDANGKVSTTINDKAMTNGRASTLYYVLEDIYGNKTINSTDDGTKIFSTVITASENVDKQEKVASATAPAKTDAEGTAKFTWTVADETTLYTANLYYKATADATPEIIYTAEHVKTATLAKIDELDKKIEKPGFYYIEVITEASANKSASDSYKSPELEVTQLKPVKDLKYVGGLSDNITWNNEEYKDLDTSVFSKVSFEVKASAESDSASVADANNKTDTKATMSTITDGVIYTVEATVEEKNLIGYIDSEAVASEPFFTLGTTTVDTIGNTTITLKEVPDIKVNDKSATYIVELIEYYKGTAGKVVEGEKLTRECSVVDGKLVIPNLKAGTMYQFRLTCKTADGTTATTDWYPTTQITTLPEISKLKVAKLEVDLESNGIYSDGSSRVVIMDSNGNKVEYKSTDYSDTSTLFENIAIAISGLEDNDVVTLDSDKNTLEITFNNEKESPEARTLGDLSAYSVTLNNGSTRRKLTMSKAKDLTLKSGLYDLTGVTTGIETGYITCNNGVDVTNVTTNKLKILANAEVTIDGVVVKPSVDTFMKYTSSSNTLDISMTKEQNNITISNNLKAKLVVNFETSSRPESITQQLGSITIVNGGDVTVTAKTSSTAAGSVEATMNITVTDGNVDLTEKNISGGSKTITVNNTDTSTGHTVTGYATNKFDDTFLSENNTEFSSAITIDLSEEFDIENKYTWTNITKEGAINAWNSDKETNADKIKTVIKYLQDNFGSLIGRNATIEIDQSHADNGYAKIKITIKDNTTENGAITITGLK